MRTLPAYLIALSLVSGGAALAAEPDSTGTTPADEAPRRARLSAPT